MPRPVPHGRLIDVGGHRLHLSCAGTGSPCVIFDAALGASSLSWGFVQPEVARVTRACSYDRAGFGWSDAGPMPRTARRIADELRELLRRAEVRPPFVLVGHSFGALVMRLLAARHPGDVAGMVLVDPAHPEEWLEPGPHEASQIARGMRLCGYGASAARLGLARAVAAFVALGALAPARALVALVSRGGLSRADEEILAPIWKLPPEARRALPHFWTQPKFFEALGSQIGSICHSASEVQAAERERRADLPLVTISSARASARRLQLQAALAGSSSRGRHIIAASSGHWVPLDEPQTVVAAIVELIAELRSCGVGSVSGSI